MPTDELPEPGDEPPFQFTESGLATSADYARGGAFALDAYAAGVQPQFLATDHRTDPKAAADLLEALLHDLFHYADHHHVDLSVVAHEARLSYSMQRLDECRYRVGTLVQLTDEAAQDADTFYLARRGSITAVVLQPGRPVMYEVTSIGGTRAQLTEHELQPASAFKPIATGRGVIDTPAEAETTLVALTAELGLADRLHRTSHPSLIRDRDALLAGLSEWSGLPADDVQNLLAPAFEQALADLEDAHGTHPADLAAADFPLGPTDTSAGPPIPGDSPHGPSGPHRGPRPR